MDKTLPNKEKDEFISDISFFLDEIEDKFLSSNIRVLRKEVSIYKVKDWL